MELITRLHLTRFALLLDQVMRAIPRTAPPPADAMPLDEWDAVIDATDLDDAYRSLPASLQAALAPAYQRCTALLQGQYHLAGAAYAICCEILADIMTHTGLTPEQLIPELRADGRLHLVSDSGLLDQDDAEPTEVPTDPTETPAASQAASDHQDDASSSDGDSDPVAAILPFPPPLGDPDNISISSLARRAWSRLGPATLVAAICLTAFTWHRLTMPAPTTAAVPATTPATLSVSISNHDGAPTDIDATVSMDTQSGDTITQVSLPTVQPASDHQIADAPVPGDSAEQPSANRPAGARSGVIEVRTRQRGSHTTVTIEFRDLSQNDVDTW